MTRKGTRNAEHQLLLSVVHIYAGLKRSVGTKEGYRERSRLAVEGVPQAPISRGK